MVTLVAGPPCAGKSFYVEERAKPGDLILDSDALYVALSGRPLRERPESVRPFVWKAYFAVLAECRASRYEGDVWAIHSAPDWDRRDDFRRMNYAKVVVLETPPEVCGTRALIRYGASDPRFAETLEWIDEWWSDYEPDVRDTRIAVEVGSV